MTLTVLSRALVVTFRVLAGQHAVLSDAQGMAEFELRCTKDALVVQSRTPEPTAAEVKNAGPVLARVGYAPFYGGEERPYVLVAAAGDEDLICDLRIGLSLAEGVE